MEAVRGATETMPKSNGRILSEDVQDLFIDTARWRLSQGF